MCILLFFIQIYDTLLLPHMLRNVLDAETFSAYHIFYVFVSAFNCTYYLVLYFFYRD